jgi:predicted GNAT family acetyltransferase
MSAKEYGFAVDLANTMNWNMEVGDFRFNQFLEPEGCLVLFNDSVLVGMATCLSFGKMGWFGNFIIKKEYRGRGIGCLLLEHAVSYLRGRGVESIGLYAYPYFGEFYSRFGFKADIDLTVMCSNCLQTDNLGVSKFESQPDFSVLAHFDRQFFGADRSRLLKSIMSEKTNLCYASMDGKEVAGYVLAKVYERTAEIGPLVCHADKSDVAFELLKTVLSMLRNRRVLLYLPQNQGKMEEFLLGLGFRKDFSLLRMFLGKPQIQSGMHLAESLERG